ncbi:hypothetical protein IGJ02_002721 [Enterococcus sp. DIV0724b]|uniref:LPXTG cell wall anchor domain-containing protein n=1 Tax=Enterococcus sp. DIV0724b TaxID=2774694 RepID=UPI003D2FDBEF
MKQMRIILFCCSLILCLGAVYTGYVVLASEEIGGQVSTNGKISFYEESAEPDISTDQEPVSATPSKPNGKPLPNTGEQIQKYGVIGVVLIFLILLVLFLRKRRKGEPK